MSVQAKAVEALVGGGLGAIAGGVTGGLTHQTATPREWEDERGLVYSRPLSPEEKSAQRGKILKAALLGAGGGAALSMGGSAGRRALISRTERSNLPSVVSKHTGGLRKIVGDLDHEVVTGPKSGDESWANSLSQQEKAHNLLQEHESKIGDLLNEAAENRKAVPWGGIGLKKDKAWLTHEGQVSHFFKKLQQEYGLPPLAPDRAQELGLEPEEMSEVFYKKLLEKKSSVQATVEELKYLVGTLPVLERSSLELVHRLEVS